ncbi:YcxB family protein [Dysosmobacter sp.]|uniref:YcxB family protein n=1 Tax=Dysosmobacter sp. TaxID=2591382 RepID=UPI002A8C11F6|nr:YcxB family protein [Dysosmobacter sp.]MDY3282425.1 YcxB family protein [Dysosmobacter sp.]
MEFRFTGIDLYGLQQREWDAFYHAAHRLSPVEGLAALVLRLLAAVCGILMLLVATGILVSEDSSPWGAVVPGILCVLNLSIAVGYRRYAAWLTKRLTSQKLARPGETMSVTINDGGVTDRTGGVTTHYEFSALYAVCWCRDVTLLFVSRRSALVLPERYLKGGSGGELLRFLEEKTGKPVRYFGKELPAAPQAEPAAAETGDSVEFRVEETYEKRDFAGLATAVRYRKGRGRVVWKVLKAALGIWTLSAGLYGLALLWADSAEIFGPGVGGAGMTAMVLPCLVLSVCGIFLLLSLARTPLGAGASWRNYPEKGTPLVYCLTENGVTCQSAGSRLELAYSRIRRVLEDRERFYLFVDRRAAHILRKDGFVQGTPEDFPGFITRKTGQPVEYIK